MQYQVYEEKTGELIAWIDTKDSNGITKEGYAIKCGEDLTCVETQELSVARFEKVSGNTYHRGCCEEDIMLTIPKLGIIGTDDYLDELVLPHRSTKGSAGYDFFLPYDLTVHAGETVRIPTGVKVQMAEGYVLMMYPRSSLGFKYQMTMDNTVCVVDSDYYNNPGNEGHIFVKMTNHSNKDCFIPKGQAYCQGVFHRYYIADDDDTVAERVGGYGSTNK